MYFDTGTACFIMPFSIRFIDLIEPEKVVHDKVAAEDACLGMFAWLLVKPETDHRVGESVWEEESLRRKTAFDNGFSRG